MILAALLPELSDAADLKNDITIRKKALCITMQRAFFHTEDNE